LLCLFHDTPEARLGDIPSVGKHYLDAAPERVVADQTDGLPIELRRRIADLVLSYEDGTEPESILAKDADKLECLAQAIQYVEAGSEQAASWIKPLMTELSSPSAIEMAGALQRNKSSDWWKRFVETYRSAPH
jgi:putative hydrolase of HD superfamily